MEKIIQHDRREFFRSLSGLFIGAHLITGNASLQDEHNTKNLWDEFTDEENNLLQSSAMGADILNYPKRRFSCAGSILACSLAFLGRCDEISHVASSFGGGIGRADLCGLLTGGHMAIGVSAGMIHKDVKERQKYAREISNKYWDWWKSLAPIHCSELKPQYDREGYARMIQRVALKIEELIKPALLQ